MQMKNLFPTGPVAVLLSKVCEGDVVSCSFYIGKVEQMKNLFPTAAAAVLLRVKLVKVRWRAIVYLPFSSSAFHSSPTKPLIRKRGNLVTPLQGNLFWLNNQTFVIAVNKVPKTKNIM